MARQLTRAQAEECLAAVNEQFKEYVNPNAGPGDKPTLYEPGFHTSGWSIAWEGGPYEWSILAFQGGLDEEMYQLSLDALRENGVTGEEAQAQAREAAKKDPHPVPAGVFVEPVSGWCLGLYRED